MSGLDLASSMPMTPRAHLRQRRRLKVLVSQPRVALFTLDVSEGGLALEAPKAPLVGARQPGAVVIDGVDYPFEGRIAWALPGDHWLGTKAKYGVAFVTVHERYVAALQGARTTPVPTRVLVPSKPSPSSDVQTVVVEASGSGWVVRVPSGKGKVQVYHCAEERQARQLAAAFAPP